MSADHPLRPTQMMPEKALNALPLAIDKMHAAFGRPPTAAEKLLRPLFSTNQDRLMEGEIAEKFVHQILDQASAAGLVSDEHSSVDGTLIGSVGQREEVSAEGSDRRAG